MTDFTPNANLQPSAKTVEFLKLFARNYRAKLLSNGEYLEIILS